MLPRSIRAFSYTIAKKAVKEDDDSASKDDDPASKDDSSQRKQTTSRGPGDFTEEDKQFILFKIFNKVPLNIHEAMWAEDYVRKREEEAGQKREQNASSTGTSRKQGKGPNSRPSRSRDAGGPWRSAKDRREDMQQWNEHVYEVLSKAKDQGESAYTEALIGIVNDAIDRSHGPMEEPERYELFLWLWEMLRRDIAEKGEAKAKAMTKKAGNPS
ncbi:hypothetical protein CcaCcLH18_13296 [Colletotrichum camelliae]|nr:hypothetical protein CcaCcLH18_13296 [Colletotrichum camelliae]